MEDVNRRYFVDYVRRVAPAGATVLDFGCGDGGLVRMLRAAGYEAYGVDIRWPGADYGDIAESDLGRAGFLRYYEEGGALPFDDGCFDVVVSDQVLEHVRPLEATVRELERVGRLGYHHFPSRTVWREGHIGIPFAHRLPPGRARLAYATALRRLGLGVGDDERRPRQWAAEMLDWIDRWTVYRDVGEVEAALGGEIRHRELEYCRFRAGDRWRPLLRRRRPVEAVFRRLGFEAIEVRPRPGPPRAP